MTPGWPGDPASVAEAHANPDAFAGTSVGDIAAYQQAIIEKLDRVPAISVTRSVDCSPRCSPVAD